MSQRFPPEVHEFIRCHVNGLMAQELADLVNEHFQKPYFTAETMRQYKNNHKLSSGRKGGKKAGFPTDLFPQPIFAYVFTNYRGTGPTAMAARLNSIFGTTYTPGQLKRFYSAHKLNSGLTGHFELGSTPPNKGKKGISYPGTEKTQFRKGNRPHNWVPVGTVVTKSDGYLWKKIAEKKWRQLHLLLWEAANGPVPEGCYVIFKDGDRTNCVLENLAVVERSVHAIMNKNGLRFQNPQATESGILIAKIKHTAARRTK